MSVNLVFPGMDDIRDEKIIQCIQLTMRQLMEYCTKNSNNKLKFCVKQKELGKNSTVYWFIVSGIFQHIPILEIKNMVRDGKSFNALLTTPTTENASTLDLIFSFYTKIPPPSKYMVNSGAGIDQLKTIAHTLSIENAPQNIHVQLPTDFECAIRHLILKFISTYKCNSNLTITVEDYGYNSTSGEISEMTVVFRNLSHPINLIALCSDKFARTGGYISPHHKGITFKLQKDNLQPGSNDEIVQQSHISKKRSIQAVYDDEHKETGLLNATKHNKK
jgi:hypothetical protein